LSEEETKKLKELFRGETLDGFIEAGRVRGLNEFLPERPPRVLRFTRRVLGPVASQRLLQKQVVQTIRSDAELGNLVLGEFAVYLDNDLVGKVSVERILPDVKFSKLTVVDAQRGGFQGLVELYEALKRAGYRFKRIEEYYGNVVQFHWV